MGDHKSRNRKQISKQDNLNTNGLLLETKYIPEEILIKILYNVDHRTLLSCQLVCKRWQNLIQCSVWFKKAKGTIKQKLLIINKDIPWMAYYFICAKLPFNKSLLKNHFSKETIVTHCGMPAVKSITWCIKYAVVPVLPDDSLFSVYGDYCCITSNDINWKCQIVDLIKEGFSQYLLDEFQPKIIVSEWYCCQETLGLYLCDIEFLKDNGEKMLIVNEDVESNLQDHYTFIEIVKETKRNKWLKLERIFKNYGKGLRKINFTHGGKSQRNIDDQVDIRMDGVKMARACTQVDLPLNNYTLKTI